MVVTITKTWTNVFADEDCCNFLLFVILLMASFFYWILQRQTVPVVPVVDIKSHKQSENMIIWLWSRNILSKLTFYAQCSKFLVLWLKKNITFNYWIILYVSHQCCNNTFYKQIEQSRTGMSWIKVIIGHQLAWFFPLKLSQFLYSAISLGQDKFLTRINVF